MARTANRLQPAVIMNIQRQPGANIIDVVDRDQEAVAAAAEASLPAAIKVSILTDRTTTIRAQRRRRAVRADADRRAWSCW